MKKFENNLNHYCMKFRSILAVLFFSGALPVFGQYTDVINSNRPSESMSAFAVGKTVIQLETGINYINENHDILERKGSGLYMDFTMRYGFLREQLEFIGEGTYQSDKFQIEQEEPFKRSGMKSMNLGLKYLIYDPYKNKVEKVNLYSWRANKKFKWSQLIPAVSVYAGLNLNFSNPFLLRDEKPSNFSPKAMLITQNTFGGGFVFITNVYMDKITTDYRLTGYMLTLTKSVRDDISIFLENRGYISDYYADGVFGVGAAYLVNKNFQVDCTLSKNIKTTPGLFYGGFGLSWRSDTNYKEVKIAVPKEQSKTDKKMEKQAKKKKKRMDEVEVEKP